MARHVLRGWLILWGIWAGASALAQSAVWERVVHNHGAPAQTQCDGPVPAKHGAVRDAAGNLYVTGCVTVGANIDILTIKYANDTGAILWQNRYNGPANRDDAGVAMALSQDGGVVVTGRSHNGISQDLIVLRYAADGTLLWRAIFDGPAGKNDAGQAVAIDGQGAVIVAGKSANASNDDIITLKYDVAGNLLWQHRLDGGAGADIGSAVAIDGNGDVVVAGRTTVAPNDYDAIAFKLSGSRGELMWQNRFAGAAGKNDVAYALALDRDGNAIVAGYTTSLLTDMLVAKFSASTGAELWHAIINGIDDRNDIAYDVMLDSQGDVLVGGYMSNRLDVDAAVLRLSAATGQELWRTVLQGAGPGADQAYALAGDGGSGLIVTGIGVNTGGRAARLLAKLAMDSGQIQWQRIDTTTGGVNDVGSAVVADDNGNVLVAGQSGLARGFVPAKYKSNSGDEIWRGEMTRIPLAGSVNSDWTRLKRTVALDANGNIFMTTTVTNGVDKDMLTLKLAPDGTELWRSVLNGATLLRDDTAYALTLDAAGNAIVVGSSEASGNAAVVVKYAAADGRELWRTLFAPEGDGEYSVAKAVVTDATGHIFIAGFVQSAVTIDQDMLTAKLRADDGSIVWRARYRGENDSNEEALAIAVDASGNVAVAGYRIAPADGNLDMMVLKYATNGTELWANRYRSPGGGNDVAHDIVMNAAGDVLVTGYSGTAEAGDLLVAKYAAGGALEWMRLFDGAAHGADIGYGMSLAADGGVLVTGTSADGAGGASVLTMKYASDGVLVWSSTFPGLRGQAGAGYAIAQDPDGNAITCGYLNDIGGMADHILIKHAGRDGALLWFERYAGTGGGDDKCLAIATSQGFIHSVGTATPAGLPPAAIVRKIANSPVPSLTLLGVRSRKAHGM